MSHSRSALCRRISEIAAAVTALLLLSTSSQATMVLDQVVNPLGGAFTAGDDLVSWQSFVVGVTGNLTEIDLWSIDPGATPFPDGYLDSGITLSSTFSPVLVDDIYGPADGATPIGSAVVPDPAGLVDGDPLPTGWVPYLLTSPIPVAAGETLYFALDNGTEGPVWGTSYYPNGSLTFLCYGGGGCSGPAVGSTTSLPTGSILYTPDSMAFRTWVNTPEPPRALLLGLFAALLCVVRRNPRTRSLDRTHMLNC